MEGNYDDIYNLGYAEGYTEGYAKGLAEGREERIREIVIGMLKSGRFMLEEIAAYSKLALSEVQKLAQSLGTTTA